jgi:hypothetical protein
MRSLVGSLQALFKGPAEQRPPKDFTVILQRPLFLRDRTPDRGFPVIAKTRHILFVKAVDQQEAIKVAQQNLFEVDDTRRDASKCRLDLPRPLNGVPNYVVSEILEGHREHTSFLATQYGDGEIDPADVTPEETEQFDDPTPRSIGAPTPEPRSLGVSMLFPPSVGTHELRARGLAADAAFNKLTFSNGSRCEGRSAWEHGYHQSKCWCSLYAPDLKDESDAVAVEVVVSFVESIAFHGNTVESITATSKDGNVLECNPFEHATGMTP